MNKFVSKNTKTMRIRFRTTTKRAIKFLRSAGRESLEQCQRNDIWTGSFYGPGQQNQQTGKANKTNSSSFRKQLADRLGAQLTKKTQCY